MDRYKGKTVLITGGTSGIGLATAKLMVAEGARVMVTGRTAATIEAAQTELGDEHGSGVVQTLYDDGVLLGLAILEGFGAVGRRDSRGVQEILRAPRNAMQRPAILAGGDFFVGLLGLLHGKVASQRDHTVQLGIELLQSLQIDVREALGGEFTRFDPARELRDGRECDVLVVPGQRAGID